MAPVVAGSIPVIHPKNISPDAKLVADPQGREGGREPGGDLQEKRGAGRNRACQSRSSTATQMPDASTQPHTRAKLSGIHRSSESGTTTSTTTITSQTPALRRPNPACSAPRVGHRPLIADNPYNLPVQPPDSLKSLSDPIYETFYGLKEQPFAISTDPKFLFLSAPHRRAYDELMNGITRDESLLLLTGETGSGKTTLCRAIIGALGERTFSSVLHQPYMTGPEMLRLILRDFGLVSQRGPAPRRAGRRRRAAPARGPRRRSCDR